MSDMKLPDEIREFFRKQGAIGAKKRKANLTPERRSEIARLASEARWSKAKQETSKKSGKAKGAN